MAVQPRPPYAVVGRQLVAASAPLGSGSRQWRSSSPSELHQGRGDARIARLHGQGAEQIGEVLEAATVPELTRDRVLGHAPAPEPSKMYEPRAPRRDLPCGGSEQSAWGSPPGGPRGGRPRPIDPRIAGLALPARTRRRASCCGVGVGSTWLSSARRRFSARSCLRRGGRVRRGISAPRRFRRGRCASAGRRSGCTTSTGRRREPRSPPRRGGRHGAWSARPAGSPPRRG